MQALAAPVPGGQAAPTPGGYAPGHVLVRYAPGKAPPPRGRDTLLPQLDSAPAEFQAAPVLPGESVEAAAARLAASDDVLYAEPDFYLETDLSVSPAPSPKARAAQKYPNDYQVRHEPRFVSKRLSPTCARLFRSTLPSGRSRK